MAPARSRGPVRVPSRKRPRCFPGPMGVGALLQVRVPLPRRRLSIQPLNLQRFEHAPGVQAGGWIRPPGSSRSEANAELNRSPSRRVRRGLVPVGPINRGSNRAFSPTSGCDPRGVLYSGTGFDGNKIGNSEGYIVNCTRGGCVRRRFAASRDGGRPGRAKVRTERRAEADPGGEQEGQGANSRAVPGPLRRVSSVRSVRNGPARRCGRGIGPGSRSVAALRFRRSRSRYARGTRAISRRWRAARRSRRPGWTRA